ncbi:SDR family NAD(P)-dependent oxidoreductase [Clostridium estertheticum]|uniref:SDR family NAD(P)-dependent oxidoreductase n=1 Tax=Clostridium estertheticum TaxID=238834 RepID=UPI001CF3A1CF|nr:SDR family NAD(P)-dependent oxidoreductase [Clostridium estertheticum]MCB2360151.1 SDR family NAD(P)-dependent oxidoreductase [Clostridium estertheticum]
MLDLIQYILKEIKQKRVSKYDGIDLIQQFQDTTASKSMKFLHPFVHFNTSNLSMQYFSSIFTGQEFFLAQHLVKGKRVLPGVAYLEMARAAIELSITKPSEESLTYIQLKNVAWIRPMVIDEQFVNVHIRLSPTDNGQIIYDIYSENKISEGGILVHSKGGANICSFEKIPTLNLELLKSKCNHTSLTSEFIYNSYKAIGLEYGAAYKAVESVFIGKEQVLAKLALDPSIIDSESSFILHPGLMDSALQASMGLFMASDKIAEESNNSNKNPSLPFALEEINVYGKCTSNMWAWIRLSERSNHSNNYSKANSIQKIDIDLCDENGEVQVTFRGLSSRVLDDDKRLEEKNTNNESVLLKPYWKESINSNLKGIQYKYEKHLVFICEFDSLRKEHIEAEIEGVICINLQSSQEYIDKRFEDYVSEVFCEIQNIIRLKPSENILIQFIVPDQKDKQEFCGISGLLKTAQLENPKIIGQVIEIPLKEKKGKIIKIIVDNSKYALQSRIRYEDEKKYTEEWKEIDNFQRECNIPWKDEGIYLITGGAGGLGLIFADEIAKKVKGAVIILTGRSSLNLDKKNRISEIESLGVTIIYKRIDVSDKESVESLIQDIINEFSIINGVIHSAGVIKDNFILNKNLEELKEVLAPKVSGTVNLDEGTNNINLDFFVLFSSMAGSLGNLGQADYSAANAFMDNYADYRNSLVILGERSGKTLSINWPLWKEGGMKIHKEIEIMNMHKQGAFALESSVGIKAFYQGMVCGENRIMVIQGDLEKIRKGFNKNQLSIKKETKQNSVVSDESINEKATNHIKSLISSVIKVPIHRIEDDAPFSKYGIDSIIAIDLTNTLEKIYGSLSKTLFFEYQNVRDITGYFLKEHNEKIQELLGLEQSNEDVNIDLQVIKQLEERTIDNSKESLRFIPIPANKHKDKLDKINDIAIISLSGRYPGATNIRDFWKVLCEGRDCITEIPKERWDNRLFFDETKGKAGKTYCNWGGFIESVAEFDPILFNMSPREAEITDPMDRLFLESVWELFESIGYTRETLNSLYKSKVGVFVGAMYQQYNIFQSDIIRESATAISSYSSIANRISHYFNFQGPSLAIDTMCSSSTIAIHMACESIKNGECEIAVAGGVNLSIHPKKYIGLSQAQMLGSHVNSRSFADGDGYLPSEGVGSVLLKSLDKAIEDGDEVLAVIKATATNHSGHTNSFSVPNPNSQAQLIENNFKKSGISPRTISYVEAAANGSKLGDTMEINALNKAFSKFTSEKQFCAIGSVKSNIGHPEAVSGMAQLSKVILQLMHKKLVPSIKANPLNPNIDFENTPFYLQQELQEWREPNIVIEGIEQRVTRRATISSFGAGGSNAHLILEEYVPKENVNKSSYTNMKFEAQIAIFSAKSNDRLLAIAKQMSRFLENSKSYKIEEICHTLQVGREEMEYRLAMVVNSKEQLVDGLRYYIASVENATDIDIEGNIPIFYGNTEDDSSGIKRILVGKLGETIVEKLIEEEQLDKIALYWTQGGKITWQTIYRNHENKLVYLPTYPFERRFCWVNKTIRKKTGNRENNSSINKNTEVIDLIANLLGLSHGELNINKELNYYGFDSIFLVTLYNQLKLKFDLSITLDKLQNCRTINDILAVIMFENKDETSLYIESVQSNIDNQMHIREKLLEFPEAVHLNSINEGRPVFWFHAALGGVETYQEIAGKSNRPFYGIQARGWMTNRTPFHGIQAMASYYVYIIRSIQTQGPYDLGGYSLGGDIAYEVTRQLQELGQTVETIVMLDSFDSRALKKLESDEKSLMLQTVNTAIVSMMKDSKNLSEIIINRDEVDLNVDSDVLLSNLIKIARERGLSKTNKQLHTMIKRNIEIQSAYEIDKFFVLPLNEPKKVKCYYFRNKSGLVYGQWEPYFSTKVEPAVLVDNANYFEEWEKHLPNFSIIEVDSSNHMTLLADVNVKEQIYEFCKNLYS